MRRMIAWVRPRRKTRREKLALLIGGIIGKSMAQKRRKK